MPPTPPAERSTAAAVAVVERLHAALGRHDWRTAYAIWHGRYSYPAYVRGYARTRAVRVTVTGPVAGDAATGSVFATVPVRIDARLVDGTRQHFIGSYTLRRVNDVDGSTAAQRRWHIEQAHLRALN